MLEPKFSTTNTKKGITIAIDGPVASGKGTIAPLLAEKLQGFYLQTGAMYRAVALRCIQKQVDWSNEEEVLRELPGVRVRFEEKKVFLNDVNVTEELRKEMVGMASSKVAMMPRVRAEMIERQQKIAQEMLTLGKAIIAEGRDTATRLFPEASLKIFLTATPETRAHRRLAQLRAQGRKDVLYTKVFDELLKRDTQDQERRTDPLVTEPEKHGYIIVDSSDLTEAQTVEEIVTIMKEKGIL